MYSQSEFRLPQANRLGSAARHTLVYSLASGLLSTAALLWRGRRETGNAAAAINAPSHWLYGDRALRQDGVSARYTLTGSLIHFASSGLWGALYETMRRSRRRPTPVNAVTDAVALTAVASVVDLVLVPRRLTPGFERRLRPASTALVYAGFAVALALTGAVLSRRRSRAS
jgi:hypothetical protein